MNETRFPYILRLAAIMVTLVLTVLTMYFLKVVLVPLLFSIIFAIMLFPACSRMEKWGLPRGLSSFMTVFLGTFILGFLAYTIFMQIGSFSKHLPEIQDRMSGLIDKVRDYAAERFNIKKAVVSEKINEQLTVLENQGGDMVTGSVKTISVLLINIFLIPLYIFFLLYYRHFFIEFFYKVFQRSNKEIIDETLTKINLVIKGYLFGQFLDILIIGIVNSAALYFIGIGYPIILGFGIAVFCIIPYIGMIMGSAIALIAAVLTTETVWQPTTAFVVLWIIHILDSNLVAPLVIGSRVSINVLMGIMMLFMFGALWGLPGLFLAFPLTAILKVICDTVPALKPYGFLLGEPEKYHLKRHSMLHIKSLQRLVERKKKTTVAPELPGEVGNDEIKLPAE